MNSGNALLVTVGTVAIVVGVLLVSPLAIRLLARAARPLPVAVRLALRDLARYRARSGAALAAIGLALGIPVAIVVTAAAAAHGADAGNLSDDQLMVRTLGAMTRRSGTSPSRPKSSACRPASTGRGLTRRRHRDRLEVAVDPSR